MDEKLELSASQRADYDEFKRLILRRTGIDLGLYKPQQMHRRLMGMVERAKVHSFAEYYRLIESNPDEWTAFLDRMTINVSELFRNPEKWEELRTLILPGLLAEGRTLKVWSAGCSFGAEPYTLAMILADLSPRVSYSLVATDIDQKILQRAQKGIFTEADVKNVPRTARTKYLRQQGSDYEVAPAIRDRIVFRRHNLLADRFDSDYDLIVCRNVVIYFTDEAKDALFRRFAAALRPGGVLFVGGTERIFNAREIGLESRVPFFYERKG